jgi:hypothetical protein
MSALWRFTQSDLTEDRPSSSGIPSNSPQNRGTPLAPFEGMFTSYLTAFTAMAFAALSILTIKATVDRMWHLGE